MKKIVLEKEKKYSICSCGLSRVNLYYMIMHTDYLTKKTELTTNR